MKRRARPPNKRQIAARAFEGAVVEHYLANGGNGTQAYIAAGGAPKTAASAASELLARPHVSVAIQLRQAERLAKAKATADEVLVRLTQAHRFTVRDLCDEHGNQVRLADLNERALAALRVDGVELEPGKRGEGPTLRIAAMRQRDPNQVADMLHKHLGIYEVDNRQRAPRAVAVGQLTVGGMDFEQVHPRAPRVKDGG